MFLNDNLKIFSGSSNPVLASDVCKYLGIPVGGAKIDRFPDGEKVIGLLALPRAIKRIGPLILAVPEMLI
jgi:phosphoribosylpyrophosphate synthetase